MTNNHRKVVTSARLRRAAGLSLVELLISLAITAILLTATMVAVDASFYAYASAAEQASTQTAARMVTHRVMSLIRTSTLHGPVELPNPNTNPPVTLNGDTVTSHFIELVDTKSDLLRVEYDADQQTLFLTVSDLNGLNAQTQPILTGVTNAQFSLVRRLNEDNLFVLSRATFDITALPAADTTLDIEQGPAQAVRYIASTMPRKLE